jgi:hypothetical protein
MCHLQSSEVPEHFIRGWVLTYTVFILHDLFEQAVSKSLARSLMQEIQVKQWLCGMSGYCRIICTSTSHITHQSVRALWLLHANNAKTLHFAHNAFSWESTEWLHNLCPLEWYSAPQS